MFFVLSKTISLLLLPFTWIIVCAILAFFSKNKKKLWSGITCGLLLFFSNNIIINELMLRWEQPLTSMNALPYHDIAIVLGGATHVNPDDTSRVFFNASADRVMHTLQLFKKGKIGKILYSGGAGNLFGEKYSEGTYVRNLFVAAGVPDSCILIEPDSKNTHENALFTAELLKAKHLQNKRLLLVTSGYHLKRSLACFKKEGLTCTPFATEIVTLRKPYSLDSFFPNTEGFTRWYVYTHEVSGYFMYRLMGYCD